MPSCCGRSVGGRRRRGVQTRGSRPFPIATVANSKPAGLPDYRRRPCDSWKRSEQRHDKQGAQHGICWSCNPVCHPTADSWGLPSSLHLALVLGSPWSLHTCEIGQGIRAPVLPPLPLGAPCVWHGRYLCSRPQAGAAETDLHCLERAAMRLRCQSLSSTGRARSSPSRH